MNETAMRAQQIADGVALAWFFGRCAIAVVVAITVWLVVDAYLEGMSMRARVIALLEEDDVTEDVA